MKITFHAAQRFIERVLKKEQFSRVELAQARDYLESLTKDVVLSSYCARFALPEFRRFSCVCQENTLVTIIPKDKKVLKSISKSRRTAKHAVAA
jgi:hypothetical protein